MGQRANPTDLDLAAPSPAKFVTTSSAPSAPSTMVSNSSTRTTTQEAKNYALDVIRNVTEQASARLQFCRFAFGAAGSAGAHDRPRHRRADLAAASSAKASITPIGRPSLATWARTRPSCCSTSSPVPSRHCRAAATSKCRWPAHWKSRSSSIRCRGTNARPPQHLGEFIAGEHAPPLDAMTIQAYYTWRLASTAGMRLAVLQDMGPSASSSAKPA